MMIRPTAGVLYISDNDGMAIVLGTYHNYDGKGFITYKVVGESEILTRTSEYFNKVYRQVKDEECT